MEAGADAMVTPCPLCHLSLDAWQQKREAANREALAVWVRQETHRRSSSRSAQLRAFGLPCPYAAEVLSDCF